MFPYITLLGRTVPVYGLFLTAGLVIASALAMARVSKEGRSTDHFLIIGATAFGYGILGAKLLYIFLTYSFRAFWSRLLHGDFTFFQEGGMVFYGGLLCGALGAVLGAKIAGTQLRIYEAAVIPCIPIGHALGRIGCFAAGCCYGMPYEGLFAVYYPGADEGRFPVQLLEAALNLVAGLALMRFAKKEREPGRVLSLYLGIYAVERFALEFLRGDRERGIFWGVSTSQWISGLIFLGCLVYWAAMAGRKQHNAFHP